MYDFIDELEQNCSVKATVQNFYPNENVEVNEEMKKEETDAKKDLETENTEQKEEEHNNESDTDL